MNGKSTFAAVARARRSPQLERPNCLNFKTKDNMKRFEVLEMLKELKYPLSKLVGLAEMKSRSIDVTCKKREYVLELAEKLKDVTSIYNLRLYETENINAIVGWVPIPMTNDDVHKELENIVGKVVKVTAKKNRDGLLSGIRIASIPKTMLEENSLPSYITIKGSETYVTYTGQTVTCRYCAKTGHVQSNCTKRLRDFPQLGNQTIRITTQNADDLTMNRSNSTSSSSNEPINLSKRKRTFSNSNLKITDVLPSKQPQMTSNNLNDIEDNNNKQSHSAEEMVTQQENDTLPDLNQPEAQNVPNWWQMACQFQCFSCIAAICTDEKEFKITCEDYGEEQFVVKPCCSDPSTNKRFSVKLNE